MFATYAQGGCVTTSSLSVTSEGPAVYVPVFVDETADTGLGLTLATAMQRHLYRHAPHRLALAAESESYVVDGTIRHLREVPADGKAVLEVCATARVHRAFAGQGEGTLVDACDEATYRVAGTPTPTAHARRRALREVTEGLALKLLEKTIQSIADAHIPEEGRHD